MNKDDLTDLKKLEALSDWLADCNELPSSGDAVCVMNAAEEIGELRKLVIKIRRKLDYGAIYGWDDDDPCWEVVRKTSDILEI